MARSQDDPYLSGKAPGAAATALRFLLRLINILLALLGLAMLGYAVFMYLRFKGYHIESHADASRHLLKSDIGFPWFIYAFGGAGLFTFLTASAGLAGVAYNSRFLLWVYSTFMVILLLAQAVLAVAYFADSSWKKRLPEDDTGEALRMERFIRKYLSIVQWVGLGVFCTQVLSVVLACSLSAAQARVLEAASEDEDEIWGTRQRPLLQDRRSSSVSGSGDPELGAPAARSDPWSAHMREKYGLDTSQFTYNPEVGQSSDQTSGRPDVTDEVEPKKGTMCAVMQNAAAGAGLR
ncbi:hypothetical protein WJX84_003256 [Apatococcus fuscideae]|uniref:Uncharacterized protein n=1 Tax=Apatococcus fuscideae TaxID=2026836 RepID=A0AAW1T3U1_9CHLO